MFLQCVEGLGFGAARFGLRVGVIHTSDEILVWLPMLGN